MSVPQFLAAVHRRRRAASAGFNVATALFGGGEAGTWYDPSDLTPEKISWRRNLLTWSESFENSAWTKSNASILSNLLTWSQDFTNATWTKNQSSITATNGADPIGGSTAQRWVSDGGATTHYLGQGYTNAQNVTYTFSGWIRSATGANQTARVFLGSSVFSANFTITSSWQRFTVTGSSATAGTLLAGFTRDSSNTAVDLWVWGAQLVTSTAAETYTPTTSAIAPIQFTDPFGNATADKLVENTANAAHSVQQVVSTTGGVTMVTSGYIKAAERTLCVLFDNSSGLNTNVFFDLSNGTTYSTGAGASGTLTLVGNGWYYFTHLTTTQAAQTLYTPQFRLVSTGTTSSYTGDGSSGLLLYGWQVERAPTASSYQRITDFTSDFLAAFPTHGLYQDSAGTTPVTALGQPVGLVIDKRLGGLSALGSEVVNSPLAGTGSGSWAVSSSAVTRNGSSTGQATVNTGTLDTTKRYRVAFTVADLSGDTILLRLGAGTAYQISANGPYTALLPAGGTASVIFAPWAGTAGQATITNISVREVPGSHAIQPTSASRPTCDARVNLLTFSEQFDNAAWVAIGAKNVTANTNVAPDGTLTADTLTDNSAVAFQGISQTITIASGTSAYVTSISVLKTTGGTSATFGINGTLSGGTSLDFTVRLNTDTGAQATSGSGVTTVVIDAGQYWRVVTTATNSGGNTSLIVRLYPATNVNGVLNADSSAATGSAVIWGADLRLASDAAFPYQRVVTASDYADVQAPRYLTFDGLDDSLYTAASVDFATWTSGARRNLLTFPSAFENSAWNKNASTVTANNAVAPDGTSTADQLIENTAAAQHFIGQAPSLGAGAYTYSVYYKLASGTRNIALYHAGANVGRQFDANGNSSAGLFNAPTAFSVTPVGNGWYRATMTATISAGASEWRLWLTDASNAVSYTGDGASGFFLWGAQLELGTTATTFQDVGTDKVSVFTGVRKLSDAATGIVAELSADTATNAGAFQVRAPSGAAANYLFGIRGLSFQDNIIATTYAAPITNVLTQLADFSGAVHNTARVNGTQFLGGAGTGGGNFGTYVLFIGRRNNATLPFNGRLYQLLVRGAATDSATVVQTERWVAQRTGIAL